MDLPIPHDAFRSRQLSLRPAGFWKGPQLIQDGKALTGKRGVFSTTDDQGQTREVRLQVKNFLDPIPKIVVDGGPAIELAPPLQWYEWVWMCLPACLVFVGGALGGIIGFIGIRVGVGIFRSERSTALKYVLTGGITLLSGVVYGVIATVLQLALS